MKKMKNRWKKLTIDNEDKAYSAIDSQDGVLFSSFNGKYFHYITQEGLTSTIHTHAKREDLWFIILSKPEI